MLFLNFNSCFLNDDSLSNHQEVRVLKHKNSGIASIDLWSEKKNLKQIKFNFKTI